VGNKVNSNKKKFSAIKATALSVFLMTAVLIAAFPWLYEVKTKAGINISSSRHAPVFFQKHTRGLFKCEWLYPYRSCPGE
jgi:hypothetical protein